MESMMDESMDDRGRNRWITGGRDDKGGFSLALLLKSQLHTVTTGGQKCAVYYTIKLNRLSGFYFAFLNSGFLKCIRLLVSILNNLIPVILLSKSPTGRNAIKNENYLNLLCTNNERKLGVGPDAFTHISY